MNVRIGPCLLLLMFHCVVGTADAQTEQGLPDAEPVIRRFIEKAGVNLTNQHAAAVAFYRTNVTEEYNGKGEVRKRTETVKRVELRGGSRTTELVLYNGREPTDKEIKRETEKIQRRHEGNDENGAPDRSRQINTYITQAILSRFVFEILGREEIEGRACLMVGFKPAPEQPEPKKIFDRVINRMGGIIWMDEEEMEMVKADIQLREQVKMWGGFLASLDRIGLKILRTRQPDGFWIDEHVEARFSGRALTKRIDVMTWDFTSPPIYLSPGANGEPLVAAE